MRQLGLAVTGRTGASVEVQIGECAPMPPDVHVAFYRIAQEALNNVIKHSHADKVELELACKSIGDDATQGREAVLCIRDNGRGFDPESIPAERLGLGIMQERAKAIGAKITVSSQPGHGTTLSLTWKP